MKLQSLDPSEFSHYVVLGAITNKTVPPRMLLGMGIAPPKFMSLSHLSSTCVLWSGVYVFKEAQLHLLFLFLKRYI